jgi:Domain of unknown function (DUF4865)
MLAMQYSFTLPADFDMDIIRQRVAAKGPAVDGFPGLGFKAFLYARRGEHGPENLYAPFYLWDNNDSMNRLLTGPVFTGVSDAFGWPSVKVWSVLHAEKTAAFRQAKYFTREIVPIAPYTALARLHDIETESARAAVTRDNALAAVAAFEPTTWTLVRARLWDDRSAELPRAGQLYVVGYLASETNG